MVVLWLKECQQHSWIKNGKVYLYSAHFYSTRKAGITQFYLQLHQCLPLSRKRSPDGASPDWGCGHLIAAYYSFIYPERKKGWVGLVGWPIQRTICHIRGHPRHAGGTQDSESSLVKDQRSALCHATTMWMYIQYSTRVWPKVLSICALHAVQSSRVISAAERGVTVPYTASLVLTSFICVLKIAGISDNSFASLWQGQHFFA